MSGSLRFGIAVLAGLAVACWPARRAVLLAPGSGGSARDWRGLLRRRRRGGAAGTEADEGADEGSEVRLGDVAAACDLVALALTSGAGVDQALTEVAEGSGAPVGAALRSIVASRRWGLDPVVGGSDLAWGPLVRAVRLAEAAGVPPAAAMRRAAEDLRSRRQHRWETATARLRVQVVLPLGLCFLPAFLLTTVVPVVLALAAGVTAP